MCLSYIKLSLSFLMLLFIGKKMHLTSLKEVKGENDPLRGGERESRRKRV